MNMLKKTTTAGLVAIALLLSACSTVTSLLGGFNPVGGGMLSVTIKDEKALYTAEAAFAGVSYGLQAAVNSGYLKGEAAGQAKVYYDRAYQALLLARKAHAAGNADSLGVQVASVLDLVSDLQAMLPKPTQ